MPEQQKDLHELYIDLQLDEGPVELEPFVKRLVKGEFGSYDTETLRDFLKDRESEMIQNIQMRAGSDSRLLKHMEEKAQEVHDWIDRLIEEYVR